MSYLEKGKCSQVEIAAHTHDSISFKRCRRKWQFSSPFQMHLQPKMSVYGANKNLWFGSGFHWAMEDYHGYNKFGDPVKAFEAYVAAFRPEELPAEIDELVPLGVDMISFYQQWEKSHAKWKTVWLDGKPLVEVKFSLVLEELCYYIAKVNQQKVVSVNSANTALFKDAEGNMYLEEDVTYVQVVFHGMIDRIVEDEHGAWWLLDYKTAAAFDTKKLALDPQVSKYCWAAEQWFQRDIEGMVYLQISKSPPQPPKTTTKGISSDKRQRTTHTQYREALIEYYGSVAAAPAANLEMLNDLAFTETENGNKYIRYDFVPRGQAIKESTYRHIIEEGKDMLAPGVALYPNPTKDCSWDCPFKDMCLSMEEGGTWQEYLEDFEVRNETLTDEPSKWQKRLFRAHPDLFPEEYAKWVKEGVDNIDDFIKIGEGLEGEDE